ncbi:MAG: WecB/TagA/CpsF family glycosyltransferase [Lachnospiraceae bacterium]|nr:WecB/TagA/CpsF family glycosyltransferase [Lachnospiraceae bacterium]
MNSKISVLDIDIDNCSAKEAMKKTMEYMGTEPVNIIEMATVNGLMQMDSMQQLKEDICGFDLVLAGDKTILEAADITDHKYLKETEGRVFLRMFMRYLHKNHKRIYLLVESEAEGQELYDYFQRYYYGLQVIGLAKVSAQNRADDMLVNDINGGEVDCILSTLKSTLQEEFIVKNRSFLDARLWLGLGKENIPVGRPGLAQGRIARFFVNRIFKKEMEKRKHI